MEWKRKCGKEGEPPRQLLLLCSWHSSSTGLPFIIGFPLSMGRGRNIYPKDIGAGSRRGGAAMKGGLMEMGAPQPSHCPSQPPDKSSCDWCTFSCKPSMAPGHPTPLAVLCLLPHRSKLRFWQDSPWRLTRSQTQQHSPWQQVCPSLGHSGHLAPLSGLVQYEIYS